MSVIFPCGETRRLRHSVQRMVSLTLILYALAGFKSGATDEPDRFPALCAAATI